MVEPDSDHALKVRCFCSEYARNLLEDELAKRVGLWEVGSGQGAGTYGGLREAFFQGATPT